MVATQATNPVIILFLQVPVTVSPIMSFVGVIKVQAALDHFLFLWLLSKKWTKEKVNEWTHEKRKKEERNKEQSTTVRWNRESERLISVSVLKIVIDIFFIHLFLQTAQTFYQMCFAVNLKSTAKATVQIMLISWGPNVTCNVVANKVILLNAYVVVTYNCGNL